MREGTYERTPIWGDVIPGNSTRSKLEDMTIDFDADPQKNQIKFALLIGKYLGSVFFDRKKVIDTATWCNCMEPGYCEQTYTDVPGIVPFLCEGSDRAVILIPGGGYAFTGDLTAKDQEETDKLARRLNEHGISAFCLDYRYNPYRFPIPLLDVQRAVRLIRFHAEEYGLDPKKIALMGGSAGGYQVAGFLNLLQGTNQFPVGYEPDEVDAVDDAVCNGGMFYPAVTLKHNKGILYATFPEEAFQTWKRRRETLDSTDLPSHIIDTKTPQFIAHGTKDMLVTHKTSRQYVKAMEAAGAPIRYIEVEGANHIFTNKPEYNWVFEEYLTWLDEHF